MQIQRGTIDITGTNGTGTATVTAVNVDCSELFLIGYNSGEATNIVNVMGHLILTNSTTVTATRDTANLGGGVTATLGFELREWMPGIIKRVQRGTIVLTGVSTNTATITEVDTAKSILRMNGNLANANAPDRSQVRLTLTNGTTITATRSSSTNDTTVAYEITEFY